MGAVVKRERIEAGEVLIRPLLSAPPVVRCPAVAAEPPGSTPPAEAAVARQLRLLNALAASLVRERSRQLTDLRPELLRLVMAICRELLGREAATDPTVIEHTLRSALATLGGADRVLVRVHPEDAVFLEAGETVSGDSAFASRLQVVSDVNLQRGECRLESTRGHLDATWATQLALMEEELSGVEVEGS